MSVLQANKPLGRGLAALLGPDEDIVVSSSTLVQPQQGVRTLSLSQLRAGKYQPRTQFESEQLQQLVDSVKQKGVLQPILVRPMSEGGYEIVAGERRFRAAQAAGLQEVPVVIKDFSDKDALETAIIENIQRQDLNPIEEAIGYRRLMNEFSYTQEDLSKVLSKSRSQIANTLRLLNLPEKLQKYVTEGLLSAGHARALLGAQNPEDLAQMVIQKGLSVRDTEKLVQMEGRIEQPASKTPLQRDPDLDILEAQFTQLFGLRTKMHMQGGRGSLLISFQNLQELDGLFERLGQGLTKTSS